MAKLYLRSLDPVKDPATGRLNITTTITVAGTPENVPAMSFTREFIGEPTQAEMLSDAAAFAVIQANARVAENITEANVIWPTTTVSGSGGRGGNGFILIVPMVS